MLPLQKDDESENQCCSAFSLTFKYSITSPRINFDPTNFSQEFSVNALNDNYVTVNSASAHHTVSTDNHGDCLDRKRVNEMEETHL